MGPPRRLDRAAVEALAKPPAADGSDAEHLSESFEETVERRVNSSPPIRTPLMPAHYRALVDKVNAAEADRAPGKCGLADAVARYLFKLMAYKDEYEVARLYTDGAFLKQVAGDVRRR